MATEALHSIPATAKRLAVSPRTVYRLIAAGDLDATDVAPTGSHQAKTRVPEHSIRAFVKSRTTNRAELRTR